MANKIQKLKEVNKSINGLLEKLETRIFIEEISDAVNSNNIDEVGLNNDYPFF